MKRCLLLLLAALPVSATDLQWSFNRSNNLFTFTFPAQAGNTYEIVRYDSGHQWYAKVAATNATTNGTLSITVDPAKASDEDEPKFSGQGWFYLITHKL